MNNEFYRNIKSQLVPNESVLTELQKKIQGEQDKKRTSASFFIKRLAPIAICLLLVLTGTFIFSSLNKSDMQIVDSASLSSDIKGLPVENFLVSDKEVYSSLDRAIIFKRLIDFFGCQIEGFVIVKVTDTWLAEADHNQMISYANAKVLQTVYGKDFPENIQLSSGLYGDCVEAKLMRVGGVYLLPIAKGNGYYDMGAFDVLFEIDDTGRIYSHSDYEGFKQYDGKAYTIVTDEIKKMVENDDFTLAVSRIGSAVRDYKLAEVTVISDGVSQKDHGDPVILYQARVTQNLSNSELPTEITIRFSLGEQPFIVKGNSYLLLMSFYNGKYHIFDYQSAIVNPNGTIEVFKTDYSYFSGYDGYSVEQIKEIADRVNQFDANTQ